MRKIPVILSLLLLAFGAQAKEYAGYDAQRLLIVSQNPDGGKKKALDVAYLDRMLNDLYQHAQNYPAKFDNLHDRDLAVRDVTAALKIVNAFAAAPDPDPEHLWRAGLLNSIGHNLGIAGAAQNANAAFRKMLKARPDDPRANFLYGVFLAGVGQAKPALPYLEKASSLGVADAVYSVGMAYLALGEKEKAIEKLSDYKRLHPKDPNVDKVIDGIRSGKIKLQHDSPPKAK